MFTFFVISMALYGAASAASSQNRDIDLPIPHTGPAKPGSFYYLVRCACHSCLNSFP